MSNWFTSLASEIASLPATSATAVSTTISGWFANKYSAISTTFETLQGLGPTANPAQLSGLLSQLSTQFVQAGSVPGAEYTYVTTLTSLIGKNDVTSIDIWAQTCTNALNTLTNASSSAL
jgi:hypothetical protein